MKEFDYNCSDIVLLLTEYYREQLDKLEKEYIKNHLKDCNYCLNELKEIKNLCFQTDKLIPSLEKDFAKNLIAYIFIKEKEEAVLKKIIAFIFITIIISFFFVKNNYENVIPLNSLQLKTNELIKNEYILIEEK